jgi:ABC-type Fe3+-siderophore transport system permease subunit
MNEEVKKRGAAQYILAFLAGLVFAALLATLFTALILFVTDFFLFTRPPSVPFVTWTGRILERIHWTFVLILWGLTLFAAVFSLFRESFERWGRRKLDGEKGV